MQVLFACNADSQTDSWFVAFDMDVVIVSFGNEDKITCFSFNWFGLSLNFPVNFALHYQPPFIVIVIVLIVWVFRRLTDQHTLHFVSRHETLDPRWIAVSGLHFLQIGRMESRNKNSVSI